MLKPFIYPNCHEIVGKLNSSFYPIPIQQSENLRIIGQKIKLINTDSFHYQQSRKTVRIKKQKEYQMLSQEYDFVFKILLIGNSSVGKSSLLLRFADDVFNQSFLPTIGVDFKIRTLETTGSIVKLQIWDTAGQQKFKTITSAYYKGAQGLLLVYDITDRKSFNDIENWMIEADKYANTKIVKILIGNKSDMEANRQVSTQQAMSFAASMGMEYIETSAKTTQNVEKTFMTLSQKMKSQFITARPLNRHKNPPITCLKPVAPKKTTCC